MQVISATSDFKDIYVHEEGKTRVFCYRSGAFVYEECLVGGRLVTGGYNAAGFPLNILEDLPTRFSFADHPDANAFCLSADGVTLDFDLAFVSFEKREETRGENTVLHGILTLESTLLPFVVRVHTVLDGTPMMARRLELCNNGTAPVRIGDLAVFAGSVEEASGTANRALETKDFENWFSLGTMQSSNWGCEGLFHWQPLPEGALCIGGKYGRGRHRHPAFFLRNNLHGSLFFGQLASAAGFEFRFDRNTEPTDKGCRARVSFRFSLAAPHPQLVLAAGEAFSVPAMHIGMIIGDLDDAVNAMHVHLRRSVFTLPTARGIKGLVEAGIGPERTMDMAAIRHFADTAAEVGAETLIIDAGWYCPPGAATKEWGKRTGDWHVDPELFPNGIAEARDYIHSKGLLFGLWMEAERIGAASRAAAEHPDFFAPSYLTGERSEFLDLTNEKALDFVESEIARVIEEYQLDLFRLDHNTSETAWFTKTVQNGSPACGLLRQTQLVEEMFGRLRRRFPDVVFENCSAGGGRTDVGMVRNFAHTWVSDWNIPPRSIAVTNGMTMVLPPEYVDRLFSGMYSHCKGSLDTELRHALFSRPTTNDYNPLGSAPNPEQLKFVRHTIEIYKSHIRPFAGRDRIYHHTPEICGATPRGVCILERAADDRTRSTIGVFRLAGDAAAEQRIFPRGIDAEKTYLVRFDNSGETAHVSGYSLKNEGIRVRLDGALQSELILLTAEE